MGLANRGDTGEHELWVKCTTSAECKIDISVELTVKGGLNPHMIIELEDDLNWCCLFMVIVICFSYLFVG